MNSLPKALFEASLSDEVTKENSVTREEADRLFRLFQQCPLFRWADAQNDCEDRANAICLLLDNWNIPNYKGWVFSGAFLKKTTGSLLNFWNYHVAAALPVAEGGQVSLYILDPSTVNEAVTLDAWANTVTDDPCSYYLARKGDDYIFHQATIRNDNWYKRDGQNYKWTIQGLAGINGVGRKGKAELVFNKRRIRNAERELKKLMQTKPI